MKVWIQGRDLTVLLVINYYALLDDVNGTESSDIYFEMMKRVSAVDMKPSNLGSYGGLYVDEEYLPFLWENKNIYNNTEKPTGEDLEELYIFDINSLTPNDIRETLSTHQTGNGKVPSHLPISEGRKLLDMIPEYIVQQTHNSTTHFYLIVEEANLQDPRQHFLI